MSDPIPINWKVKEFENDYSRAKFNIDNAFDVPATQAEENAINDQIPLPHTPDNIRQAVATRAQALCNASNDAPLKFRAVFKIPEYPEWTSVAISWPSRIQALNRIPLANRAAAQFCFEVVFGNTSQVLNWSVENWIETVIHEVGIHVIQGLHHIELWRQGSDWPTVDGEGDLDHLLFRFSGYRRYNLWRNKMTEIEKDRDQAGREFVEAFYNATAPGNHLPYDFMNCWLLALHFPNQQNQLVRDVNDHTLVDKNQSQALLGVLRGQLDQIFHYNAGVVLPANPAFYWW
ncbi:hypothetical protein F5Y19DRAFT_462355 [Xylariaceae sp. FL1651]|nr:hypothetical protein F5Y19DRAFT_462355 [Xylariaceae sp. FL1651]